jgi:hypothetical protein
MGALKTIELKLISKNKSYADHKICWQAHSEKKGPNIGQYSVLSKLLFSDKNTKYKKYAP